MRMIDQASWQFENSISRDQMSFDRDFEWNPYCIALNGGCAMTPEELRDLKDAVRIMMEGFDSDHLQLNPHIGMGTALRMAKAIEQARQVLTALDRESVR